MTVKINNTTLFESIPKKDLFDFFENGEVDAKKVMKILAFKKKNVATFVKVPTCSIRYDKKIPPDLRLHIEKWAIALNLVANFFNDTQKAMIWFKTPNPFFNLVTPRDMILINKFNKLISFVQTALSENAKTI